LFVVAKHNPWKKEEPAPFDLRCQMIEEAIKPLGNACEVCRFEEKYESPVYSYIPITEAIKTYPNDEIILIAGTDTIDRIPRWKNFETHIKNKVGFIELSRGNTKSFEATKDSLGTQAMFYKWISWDDKLGEHAYDKIQTQRIDISSTIVRNMVQDGLNPFPYVNEEVCEIIKQNNLYK
jgi:nicotinate (nicotinamide) nucleotide adenylyltransferase